MQEIPQFTVQKSNGETQKRSCGEESPEHSAWVQVLGPLIVDAVCCLESDILSIN